MTPPKTIKRMNEHLHTAIKGTIGASVPIAAAVVSWLQYAKDWLQLASLLIGCAVGIATFVSIVRKKP